MSQATGKKSRGQFSIEALFYLLALATIILLFVHLFSVTSVKIQSRQIIPSMRLAGDRGDMLVLNPEQGFAVRENGRAMSHLCQNLQSDRPTNETTYCVTRACWTDKLELFRVCV